MLQAYKVTITGASQATAGDYKQSSCGRGLRGGGGILCLERMGAWKGKTIGVTSIQAKLDVSNEV